MRRLALLLWLAAPSGADELLDKTRAYYKGLKSYQVQITCSIYKGLAQGSPEVKTVTRMAASLPARLRLDAETTRDGKVTRAQHIFDSTWQWVEVSDAEGTTRLKLALKQVTRPEKPFDTSLRVTALGLVEGTDLVGTVLGILDEAGLQKAPEKFVLGKIPCHVYTVGGERYGGDNRVALYLDDEGLLRGYQEMDWGDDGKELMARVRLDDFRANLALPAATFVVSQPQRYADKTATYLKAARREAAQEAELAQERFARTLRAGDLRNARRLAKDKPALLKHTFSRKRTPLHLAVGQPEIVEWLLEQGVDPAALDESLGSPAHYSTSLQEWQLYANKGLDFKRLQSVSRPLMVTAFGAQDPKMVSFLQAQGVAGPLLDDTGETVLHVAAQAKHPEVMVPLALALGAVPEARMANGATALEMLLSSDSPGRDAALKVLIERGVSPDLPGHDKLSALMQAVQQEKPDKVRFLLALGADPNRMMGGSSAMHDASVAGEPELLRLLLAAKGDPNLAGEMGWTPLHCAAYWGRENLCKMLLEAGASPQLTDQNGQTAWQVATHPAVKKLLAPK